MLLSPKENKVKSWNGGHRKTTQELWTVKARKTWQTNYLFEEGL